MKEEDEQRRGDRSRANACKGDEYSNDEADQVLQSPSFFCKLAPSLLLGNCFNVNAALYLAACPAS
jgi:hypothetical protein